MTTHKPDHEFELYREGDEYVVLADVGDADPADVDVSWRGGHLHVYVEIAEDGRNTIRHRDVSVPREIDPDGITASFDDGVLEVHLPVVADRVHGKSIDVETN
ncbi:MAG: Hsp20/alpha crystallin family protein [Haloarculaceae archaeon]